MLHDCFADEIAIDFPSVGHVVERMRATFLGEPAEDDVVTSELLLSSRDASDGLVVPIDVPIRATCPDCGGRGETWTEPCGACCGTGDSMLHHSVRIAVPPGIPDGTRLRFRLSSSFAPSVRVEVRVAIL